MIKFVKSTFDEFYDLSKGKTIARKLLHQSSDVDGWDVPATKYSPALIPYGCPFFNEVIDNFMCAGLLEVYQENDGPESEVYIDAIEVISLFVGLLERFECSMRENESPKNIRKLYEDTVPSRRGTRKLYEDKP